MKIFAGGDRCFATISDDTSATYDSRIISPNTQILTINMDILKACYALKDDEQVEQVIFNLI